jgi:hypothetical protein
MKKEITYKKEVSEVACLPISEFRESYQALIKLLVHNYRRED